MAYGIWHVSRSCIYAIYKSDNKNMMDKKMNRVYREEPASEPPEGYNMGGGRGKLSKLSKPMAAKQLRRQLASQHPKTLKATATTNTKAKAKANPTMTRIRHDLGKSNSHIETESETESEPESDYESDPEREHESEPGSEPGSEHKNLKNHKNPKNQKSPPGSMDNLPKEVLSNISSFSNSSKLLIIPKKLFYTDEATGRKDEALITSGKEIILTVPNLTSNQVIEDSFTKVAFRLLKNSYWNRRVYTAKTKFSRIKKRSENGLQIVCSAKDNYTPSLDSVNLIGTTSEMLPNGTYSQTVISPGYGEYIITGEYHVHGSRLALADKMMRMATAEARQKTLKLSDGAR
jgi:uncharacterized protein YycO